MSDRRRQVADGCYAIGMSELSVHIPVSLLAFARLRFREFAFGEIEDVGNTLIGLPFKCRRTDEDRNATAIFPHELLFPGLHDPGRPEFFEFLIFVNALPLGRHHLDPSQPGGQIVTFESDDAEKCIVGVARPNYGRLGIHRRHETSDDLGKLAFDIQETYSGAANCLATHV